MSGFINRTKTRWVNYQPNKKSLYKAVAHSVFWTVLLGFGLAGWTTQGGAQELARKARVDYAAALCAEKFRAADLTGSRLADLQENVVSQHRRDMLKDGHWVSAPLGTSEEFVSAAAMVCGNKLYDGGSGAVHASRKAT